MVVSKPELYVYKAISHGYDANLQVCPHEPGVFSSLHVSPKTGNAARLWNRELKINAYGGSIPMSLYLDGSLTPTHPLLDLVHDWLAHHDIALFRHPNRNCVFDELDACYARGKLTVNQVASARRLLRALGAKKNSGLWACGVIARRVDAPGLRELMAKWWSLTQVVPRDQLWLPLVLTPEWRKRVFTIDADIFRNPWFDYRSHAA